MRKLPTDHIRALVAETLIKFLAERFRQIGWLERKDLKCLLVLDEAYKVAEDEKCKETCVLDEIGVVYSNYTILQSKDPSWINERK